MQGSSQYEEEVDVFGCTKQNLRGVYNCVCGRMWGLFRSIGFALEFFSQVWDVPAGESKVKRGYNNYAYHYRGHFKGQGF